MPDGVTFVRDAVVRLSADPRRPVIVYLWQEGARPPLPPTAVADAAANPTARTYPRSNQWPSLADLERRLRDLALALGLPRFWRVVDARARAARARRAARGASSAGSCVRCLRSSRDTAVLWEPRATDGTLACCGVGADSA